LRARTNLERLGEHLVTMVANAAPASGGIRFVISRYLPRLGNWCGRRGRTQSTWRSGGAACLHKPGMRKDVRPGGAYRIVMRGPDGDEFPLKGVFREIGSLSGSS